MTFNIGDKVKFLNLKGGGVVTKIIDSRMVSVTGEDGFEIPTLISEIIKMDKDEPAARYFSEDFSPKVPPKSREEEDDEENIEVEEKETAEAPDERMYPLPPAVVKNRRSEAIYLAFVPHDQKWLVTGFVDVFLVNNTSWEILYNLWFRVSQHLFQGRDYGNVYPDSKLLLATLRQDEMGSWTEGELQFLFHKDKCESVLPPFNAELKLQGTKFYKEGSYKESPLIAGKGIVVKVIDLADLQQPVPEPEKDKPQPVETKEALLEEDILSHHTIAPREAEVDLHIHELVEDPSQFEPSEILEFQRNYVIRCMESAILNHYLKVTFIHGLGNGVLRDEVTGLLKKYEGIEFFDAPMSKYGAGAVEVRIPHNYSR